MQIQDFRQLLQKEFIGRCKRNKSYSLRSFAKSLNVEPSPLSAMLRGKRPISSKMRQRIGAALGWSEKDISQYEIAIKQSTGLSPNYQKLALDQFALISDWYHFAILELIKVRSFQPDSKYVAKALGISATEVQIAMERLIRLNLLTVNADGSWTDLSANGLLSNINGDLSSQASRQLQTEILQQSLRALSEVPVEKRSHTSMTMAMNPQDFPKAKALIKSFRRQLCTLIENNKNPTEVVQLSVSLFPITQLEEK